MRAVLLMCLGLAGCAAAPRYDPVAAAQIVDPLDAESKMIREMTEDHDRERRDSQRERAYDRDACIRAGVRGPDIEQCARDAAARRRAPPPGSGAGRPPGIACSTIDIGGGMHDTICE